ncbi:hypothetical protein DFR29_102157 [Tahibacter aquaticus]|uniref:Sulfotransferase family protein n=1 Tax=Tahibacter aquaticus TaxID=520092 RepID=A0A4R6Z6W2_9GAMM|nr:hypothetical protein [Tahibacter aquaticus]TDR47497.1 hypothetical protein DFR29_102157 [Tahibacter aquaticus]
MSSGAASSLAPPPAPAAAACFDDVRQVVLIASASRSGSSALAEWLRAQPGLLHLGGELKSILRLVGVASFCGDDCSDVLREIPPALMPAFEREFFRRLGELPPPDAGIRLRQLTDNVLFNLCCQWPDEVFCADQVLAWVTATLGGLGWRRADEFDPVEFLLALLPRIHQQHPGVCPYRYDLPTEKVRQHFPHRPLPVGPLPGRLIEETPFVLPRLWRQPAAEELRRRAVVIKDPSNIYRMGLLRKVFAKAEIRVVHLVRNPAASINGLLDGWEHRNFFSHRTAEPLQIAGYSERHPWATHWWKFDLPPGWQAVRNASVGDVCAFQWATTNRRILAETVASARSTWRIKFEDFIDAGPRGHEARCALLHWLGIAAAARLLERPRPVMVTERPAPYRWRSRENLVMNFVRNAALLLRPEELGYEGKTDAWS